MKLYRIFTDRELKYHEINATEAREINFLGPTVGARNVPVNCGPLNLTDTST